MSAKHQLAMGPALLPKREQPERALANQEHAANAVAAAVAVLPNREQGDEALSTLSADEADALASAFFAEALDVARITDDEAAYLLGCSSSLVRKMRSPHNRERVSFPQLLRLPFAFHVALHQAMNRHRRFNFTRAAVRRLLDNVGYLAAVAGD